ncbi:hypothetical protein T492DRAFT_883759 [Pavlovales sp. CCMP2436]|nr:hypothetical protein T492DRAFT_883759 [Pavlovales sp. CCMP2436]
MQYQPVDSASMNLEGLRRYHVEGVKRTSDPLLIVIQDALRYVIGNTAGGLFFANGYGGADPVDAVMEARDFIFNAVREEQHSSVYKVSMAASCDAPAVAPSTLVVVISVATDGTVALALAWHPCSLLSAVHAVVVRLRVMARAQATHAALSGPASFALSRVMQSHLVRAGVVLVRARQLADAALLAPRLDAPLARGSAELAVYARELRDTVDEWREEQVEMGIAGERLVAADRVAMLREESAALADAAEGASSSEGAFRIRLLGETLDALRHLEVDLAFQIELLRAQLGASAGADAGYSRNNFSYGSTPYGTWRTLAAATPVAAALARIRDAADSSHAFVAGSSLGWFCFYLALGSDVPAIGYELLPALHAHALRTTDALSERARALGCVLKLPELCCADILDADFSKVHLAVLASQCWDDDLRARVAAKLCAECPRGAVVIDYHPHDTTAETAEAGVSEQVPGLELLCCVTGRVSWELEFQFFILRVPCRDALPASD